MTRDSEYLNCQAHGATQWDFALYEQYLAAYRMPDGGSVTAWDNFLACNGAGYGADIDLRQLNITCNPLFDPAWYCQTLADWANESGYAIAGAAPGKWTSAAMAAHVLTELGLSLWEHFKTFGLREQINPSADFNTHAYLVARAQAMSAPGHLATVDDAIAALLAQGANPVMDYVNYGLAHGIELQPAEMPAQPAAGASSGTAVPAAPDVPPGAPEYSDPEPDVPPVPTVPADPDEPADPTDPTDPTDPAEPGEPAGPSGSTGSEAPVEPSVPDEPGDPGDLDNPWQIVVEQQGNVTVPPDNAYVIYGNVLVEMIGLGPDDFADA